MKKLNKKQLAAVESLSLNLDELTNKPRRLFGALSKFAEAFCGDKGFLHEVLDSIDDFEKGYYFHLNRPDLVRDAVHNGEETQKELLSRKAMSEKYNQEEQHLCGYRYGVEDAVKLLTKKTVSSIIKE